MIQVKDMCMRFAEMERKLGEIDRARAIFVYAAQLCDPRVVIKFWKAWKSFEIDHGNEDTFKDMLRVKRTIQAQFSQSNYMAAEMLTETPHVVSDAEAAKLEAAKEARYAGRRQEGRGYDGGVAVSNGASEAAAAAAQVSSIAKSAANIMRQTADDGAAAFGAAPETAPERPKRGLSSMQETDQVPEDGTSKEPALGAMERFKRRKAGE